MASFNVNYDDNRFKQVEEEKQSQLEQYNKAYDDLINERNTFTQQQQDYVNNWQATQEQIANDNLNHQIELYNQQKDKAEKDYQREARASYADYQKEVDRYGVSRENVVNNGLSNSGYAESSKVDMYNAYQNRLASARQSLNDIKLEFDNAIKEATMQNNATLAENALSALKQKLDIALEGFNYKDTQTQNKLTWQNNINNNYYNRYKDVESQINYENEQAEAARQFDEQMAYKKEQDRIAQQNWEREYALQQARLYSSGSGGSSSGSGGSSGGTVLTSGGGSNGGTNGNSGSGGNNGGSGTSKGVGTIRYSSLTDAVSYLKQNGVSSVTYASNVKDLIAKGYLSTETINGKLYYIPHVNHGSMGGR